MNDLRVSIIQTSIDWEDKESNLDSVSQKIAALKGMTDMVVLPEMFSTGFTSNSSLAERNEEYTISCLKKIASENEVAVAGSFIAKDNRQLFNRGFFVKPQGDICYYDKHHLFQMEKESFTPGKKRLIVSYKGWNIALFICYDLRFPVWCRNVDNNYDLSLFVASWPEVREHAWNTLLMARAIENLSYVVGVNCVGKDGNGLYYNGNSQLIDPKGKLLLSFEKGEEGVRTMSISKDELTHFRNKFPVSADSDFFSLN